MSLEPNLVEQEMLVDTRRRAEKPLVSRELLAESVAGIAFVAAVAVLWLTNPPGSFSVLPAATCFVVLVLATKVRFETPLGFTVATQLAFVPLVFALPGALVPVTVAIALALSRLPQVLSGRVPAERLLRSLGNSWFSIGPVAVFALAGTTPGHAGATILIVALAAQIVLDVAVSSFRTCLERGARISAQLGEAWVYAIDVALSVVGLTIAEDIRSHPIAALAPIPLLALLAVFAHERAERIESLLELSTAYRGTALVLGDVIEADDGYTGEHSKSVVRLALEVVDRFELDANARRNVEFAALLHDVGKIAMPKEIINKPGKLTPDEWLVIETHTLEGQKMLDRIGGFMQTVGAIVRSHHERWDGSGYPDGLRGYEIPIEARIITACDAWNAMRTDRPYRPALSYEAARAEIVAGSGSQFDPSVVEALLAVVDEKAHTPAGHAAPAAPPRPPTTHRATTAFVATA